MKRPILALFSVFFWFACSGAQPGPGAEEDKLRTESQFCGEWATAACNEEVVSACSGTRSGCLATQKSACQVLVPTGYGSENAEDCLSAVEDAYEDAELTAEELDIVLKLGGPCGTLVDGGQDEGGSCASKFDCATVDGFECVIKPGDSEGTCQVPVEAPTGGSCTGPEDTCAPDAYCDGSRCLLREVDLPCAIDEACPQGYRCSIATGETEGECVMKLANGTDCTIDEECASGVCIGTTRRRCAASVILTIESTLCDTLI